MGTLQLSSCGSSFCSPIPSNLISHNINTSHSTSKSLTFSRGKIRAVSTSPKTSESAQAIESEQQPPVVDFAFVNSVLLPDQTPDVHLRQACGGQKLRNIMLDGNIELYGPYARPLLNCGGGGTCGTCMVEVIKGKELLTPRTDKEKKHLQKKPKNWRLACQATVGKPDSRGLVVVQQLPEWKAHEWKYEEILIDPSETGPAAMVVVEPHKASDFTQGALTALDSASSIKLRKCQQQAEILSIMLFVVATFFVKVIGSAS